MTDVTATIMPTVPLHAFEVWSGTAAVSKRLDTRFGFALPTMGRSVGNDTLRIIRYEPTVWLVEGDPCNLPEILADDGALTPIGGGTLRVRISGAGWRTLLMEGGVFDAENQKFNPGSSASTIIDRVNVRLHVISFDICDAYVPCSYSAGLLRFWREYSIIV